MTPILVLVRTSHSKQVDSLLDAYLNSLTLKRVVVSRCLKTFQPNPFSYVSVLRIV